MPSPIDLRSDTVTRPTAAMRRAMAEAEVGDDVFGDDPTVNALEERAAELTGKEAGLFVSSGTMGNLVSHMTHVPRGGEIIAPEGAHAAVDEAAGHAVITGASMAQVPIDADGRLDLAAIRAAIRDPDDVHFPRTSLIVLENTNAESGGQPQTAAHTAEVAAIAREVGIPLHIDGARLFNAVVALETTAEALLRDADSATFCLSKALACPAGSVVVGDRAFIDGARRARKMVGGGMRQAGILAAAGLVALQDGPDGMIERLAEDHAEARRLAEELAGLDGIDGVDPARTLTDFVLFAVRPMRGADAHATRAAFLDELERRGVLLVAFTRGRVRAVTHHGIGRADLDHTVATIRDVLRELGIAAAAA